MLTTPRLTIRDYQPTDGPDLFEMLSDEKVVRYEPYGVFSRSEAWAEAVRRAGDPCFRAVCLKASGKLIGNVFLAEQDFGTWELGYVFSTAFQGQGLATEGCRAVLGDLFGCGRAHRVTAMCNPLNEASWRLLERLGLRREAHHVRNVWFDRDSEGEPIWQDTYVYAVLRDEWHVDGDE